jgi:hypothetical protein
MKPNVSNGAFAELEALARGADEEGSTVTELVESLGGDPHSAYQRVRVQRLLKVGIKEGRVKVGKATRKAIDGRKWKFAVYRFVKGEKSGK